MDDLRTLVRDEMARAGSPSYSFNDLVRRRDRKRRNQRIAAGVVGIAVFVAAVWIIRDFTSLDRTEESVVPGGSGTTGPAETGPETRSTYIGPEYTLGPVTDEDIALGKAFAQAWVDGDGEAAAAMFSPDGTFDGFQPAILPALHDWFRVGGWTFERDGCGIHGWGAQRGVVGCTFLYENKLTRALGLRSQDTTVSFVTEADEIKTAWFGAGGDTVFDMFGSPNADRGSGDLFGDVWDTFIEWVSRRYPDDFVRMYDVDRGYPILDPTSIGLWDRYTDEFVALAPGYLEEWLANQSFEVRARRICVTKTEEFWDTPGSGRDLHGRAFDAALADVSEEMLAELRALPLETEADRAAMDAFVPLAERWIELFRQAADEGADVPFFERRDLQVSMYMLIDRCLISYGLPG